jgi:hypothetical protein
MTWVAVGVGAAGLIGSIYGANKASHAQNQAAAQQQQIIDLQKAAANQLMPWGQNLMTQGGAGLTSLLPWYTSAAMGNRTQLQQLIRPQLNQIAGNFDRPAAMLSELSPRDTTAASNTALLMGRNNALDNALISTRMAGLSGLGDLSSRIAGLGSGAVGAAFGGLQGAAGGNLGLLSQLYGIRNQNQQQSSQLGSSIVDFLRGWQNWQANRTTPGTSDAALSANSPPSAGGWQGFSPSVDYT